MDSQQTGAAPNWAAPSNPEQTHNPGSSPTSVAAARRWLLAAWLTLALGLAGSLTGALLWRSSVRAQNSQMFSTAAADVSATLGQLLRGDIRTVEMLRAAYRMEPHMSAARFGNWVGQLESLLTPTPSSDHRGYCLLGTGTAPSSSWCAPRGTVSRSLISAMTRSPVEAATTETGRLLAFNVSGDEGRTGFVEAAVYRLGAPLGTVAERRAATIAWVASSFDVHALVSAASAGDHDLGVSLYHANPGDGAILFGRGGTARGNFTRTHTLQADGPWLVRLNGAAVTSGPSADAQALVVLLVGVLGSLLLFSMFLKLARSRERALWLAAQRSGQLRHQALHDSLTGLPNRVLALDRAEQMLARARRSSVPIAALHVDLHGFKQINDNFGHCVGDELLRIVAQRLRSVVRQGDTAARLGGDEFVVLLEGATLDAGPELVAERLLEVLQQPYDLTDKGAREVTLSASVGIAEGLRDSADTLLAEADVAVHQAQGVRQEPLGQVRGGDADGGPAQAHDRARSRPSDQVQRALPRVPADLRPGLPSRGRRRSAAALAAPGPRPDHTR